MLGGNAGNLLIISLKSSLVYMLTFVFNISTCSLVTLNTLCSFYTQFGSTLLGLALDNDIPPIIRVRYNKACCYFLSSLTLFTLSRDGFLKSSFSRSLISSWSSSSSEKHPSMFSFALNDILILRLIPKFNCFDELFSFLNFLVKSKSSELLSWFN